MSPSPARPAESIVPRTNAAHPSSGEKTMKRIIRSCVLALCCVVAGLAYAADVSGTWTASFDTQVGKQEYTYVLKVEGAMLSGTAKSNLIGDSTLSDGKVDG